MTIWPKLAIALLPGGGIALAAMALFRCRHRHEVLCIRAEERGMGLKCATCLRTRPHPFAGEPVRYHRTQAARPVPMTGIEREAERQKQAAQAVNEALALVERQTRKREIAERVQEWEARKAATAAAFRAWEDGRR